MEILHKLITKSPTPSAGLSLGSFITTQLQISFRNFTFKGYSYQEPPWTGRQWRHLRAFELTTLVLFRFCFPYFKLETPWERLTVELSSNGWADYSYEFKDCHNWKLRVTSFVLKLMKRSNISVFRHFRFKRAPCVMYFEPEKCSLPDSFHAWAAARNLSSYHILLNLIKYSFL